MTVTVVAFAAAGVLAEGHGATDTPTAADDGFDSGMMNRGDTWEFAFESAGTFEYFCRPHPYMRGTVNVDAAANASQPSVAIRNYRFEPEELSVSPGTTVTWENQDDVGHSVTEISRATGESGGYVFVWIAAVVVAVILLFLGLRLVR